MTSTCSPSRPTAGTGCTTCSARMPVPWPGASTRIVTGALAARQARTTPAPAVGTMPAAVPALADREQALA